VSTMEPLLKVENVCAGYGDVQVLHGVSFELAAGRVLALFGANGAGKTTTLRAIVGAVAISSGEVFVEGSRLTATAVEERVRRGIALVPEGRRIFADLTVQENLRIGAYTRRRGARNANRESFEYVYDRFPVLLERRRAHAGSLSGGEQQMLAIGRALMSRPKLLLLDEPSMGLAPTVVTQLLRDIAAIAVENEIAIVLAEQNPRLALGSSQDAAVLRSGVVVLQGPSAAVAGDDEMRKAYLGA
jgi:branched-chain amino acid transport system ATP-binding protein